MKLDMLLYELYDNEQINIDGEQYDLIAMGYDFDLYDVNIVYNSSEGKYYLSSSMGMVLDAHELRELFEKIENEGLRISWDSRRLEADELIDEFATSVNSSDLYAEAIIDREEDGEDMSEARKAFEEEFGEQPEDVL